ncbi:MAG TPA: CBS domain-containing protein [Candidatus Polarisedimenticolaceae bacterium]|nr:CBS domain-containing protein [Candidatus Polarisedimenticolaceae bacterium]
MTAGELMRTEIVSLHEDDAIDEAFDLLVGEHIHGAPVVGADGALIGVVSQLDIYFGKMTREREAGKRKGKAGLLRVRDVMTAPALSATEDTDVADLCRMMYKLRIHRVPIVRESRVCGIVSSMDVCEAVASGRLVASV